MRAIFTQFFVFPGGMKPFAIFLLLCYLIGQVMEIDAKHELSSLKGKCLKLASVSKPVQLNDQYAKVTINAQEYHPAQFSLDKFLSIFLPYLYFLAVAINMASFPKYVNHIINDGDANVSQKSSTVYGMLSGLDSLFTFLSVNLIGVLSDTYGRKPFMMMSAVGLGIAYSIAVNARDSALFCLAGCLDGSTSSMFSLAQAYVADCCRSPGRNNQELGLALSQFQGLAVGCAFVIGAPLGAPAVSSLILKNGRV